MPPLSVSAKCVLELPANRIVDKEVDGAVDGEEEMADSSEDSDPDWCLVTRAAGVVDGGEEKVLGQVQHESGHVEDDIDKNNDNQGHC